MTTGDGYLDNQGRCFLQAGTLENFAPGDLGFGLTYAGGRDCLVVKEGSVSSIN